MRESIFINHPSKPRSGDILPLYEKPHTDHEKHLCTLVAEGMDLAEYKELVRNPKYVCRVCGRAAASDMNLCDAVPL